MVWREFVREPLTPDELLRVQRVVGERIQPANRSTRALNRYQ